jgi:hypothetical protein
MSCVCSLLLGALVIFSQQPIRICDLWICSNINIAIQSITSHALCESCDTRSQHTIYVTEYNDSSQPSIWLADSLLVLITVCVPRTMTVYFSFTTLMCVKHILSCSISSGWQRLQLHPRAEMYTITVTLIGTWMLALVSHTCVLHSRYWREEWSKAHPCCNSACCGTRCA